MADEAEIKGKIEIEGARQSAAELAAVGEAFDKTGQKAKGAAEAAATSGSAWSKFKQDFASGFNFSAGLSAFNLLSDGLRNFGSMAITAATEYETAMNLLQAATGGTAAEMAAFGDRARELGSDLSLPATSAGGAATAMLELSKAGLSVDESMNAAKGTLQLAATEMMKESEAAQITAGALNTFGLAGNQATAVADKLAAGSNASAASVRSLAAGIQQAGFAFSANNQSLDDLVTSLAALSNVGLTGSDAGTALKNAMIQLAAPTQQSAALMERLGFNAFDAQGQMKPMEQLIGELQTALSGMTDQERNAALNTIFLSDGMKAMIPLLDLGTQGFSDLRGQVNEQGAAAKMAEAQTKGLAGAMAGLTSAAESLAVEALVPLLPAITAVVTALATGVGSITTAAGAVADNLVPALVIMSPVIAALAVTHLPAMIVSLQASATAAYSAAAAFIAANLPVIALTASLAAIVGVAKYFMDTASEATAGLFAQSEAYQGATKALEDYRKAQENTAQSLKGVGAADAAELERLTRLYEEKLKRATGDGVGNWFKAAFDSDEVTQNQIAELQQYESAIAIVEGRLSRTTTTINTNTEAAKQNDNAMALSRMGLVNYATTSEDSAKKMAAAYRATQEEIDAANKAIEKILANGPQAMGDIGSLAADFMIERENAAAAHEAKLAELRAKGNTEAVNEEIKAYQTREQTAANSYANQQAAQREHLGRMLIDWVNAQAQMNPAFAEKSAELIGLIEERYGVIASSAEKAFGSNIGAFSGFVDGTIGSIEELDAVLAKNEQQFIANEVAARKLNNKYTTELELKYERGEIDLPTYQQQLAEVPQRVHTQLEADARVAAAQAQKADDQYRRIERNIETEITANNSKATSAAQATGGAYKTYVPSVVTTNAEFTGDGAIADARTVGANLGLGMIQGMQSVAGRVANTMSGLVNNALAAAKSTGIIRSPSYKFDLEVGQPIGEGVAQGIDKSRPKAETAMEKTVNSIAKEYSRHARDMEKLNSSHAAELANIWERYYDDLDKQTRKFNGDKFDQQLDFYEGIADLDAADRAAAMERQRAAWDVAQQMAQEGRAAEAAAYYEAAIREIEADTERGERIKQIAQDIADSKKALAEATSDEERARIEEEIRQLESRKQYLEEVDQQRDQLAAERLKQQQEADDSLAKQRDESLEKENADFSEAQQKLVDDFTTAVETIINGEERQLDAHLRYAQSIVDSYNTMIAIADKLKASIPSAAEATGAAEAPADGSHAGGLESVPSTMRGYYRANLHPKEGVLTAEENTAWRWLQGKTNQEPSAGVMPQRLRSLDDGGGDVHINGPLIGQAIINNEMDIEVVAEQIWQKIKRKKGGR